MSARTDLNENDVEDPNLNNFIAEAKGEFSTTVLKTKIFSEHGWMNRLASMYFSKFATSSIPEAHINKIKVDIVTKLFI